ncbi:HlyD family type I secretion periplasmic adaptor subunit [Pseudomonas oryzihabitans]|jgi:epimerase transport system membrane fusion protein|uniref:HlyD family type I secretion periplasmic adaptor subunit n=1 Tax=Pseudomonas oryzihabitans TaxID=47885 RepID=UPI002553DF18|nr:HlyD family type I secretion periplasmic adaptor subunit [Pseudomonas oryzihabitans]MDK8262869.1 HlyD family type I secretion periplasmic adaptor subunit [Pseudomonas oryzihabitans]
MKDVYLEAEAAGLKVNDEPVRRLGLFILLIVFGIGGGWAALAPLNSAAFATGVVAVDSYRKSIQHLEGGIVREVRVRDGDEVRAGDVLVVLDSTQAGSELEATRGQLIAAQAQEARLVAERDDLNDITFGASDFPTADKRVQEARSSERQIFLTGRDARHGEIEVLKNRAAELEQQIRGYSDIISSKESLAKSYVAEIKDLNVLLKEGFVNNERLRDQERNLSRLQAEIADHRSSIARVKVQIGETKLQILQNTQKFKSDVTSRLADTQSRIYEARERVGALQDKYNRTEVKAPVGGMVMGLTVHTVGGVVQPGTNLLDIVPDAAKLIVEVHIEPKDIDRVELGTEAEVRFSAFSQATTPIIEGELVYVSADRITTERDGAPYYLGRVKLTEQGKKDLGHRELVAGMPADVLINTGSRTMLQYLLKPARNAMARSMIEE